MREDVDDEIYLLANKNLLIQVFLNIYQNACDALEGRMAKLIEVKGRLDHDREWALISFRDTGPGIAPEHLRRLFDPFFTTKEVGKGTGLGLSICYRLVKDHHGDLSVTSEPGIHTTFTIKLPISEPDVLAAS